ncbi:right-handed parallel beta-helix repeat-containing protein [Lutimonas saemankumensis]|uniref:T9SS type A sorting domain-containing protein n=1 Tax=Lutimonas saemankumensis TaxID=483016 RepID=UPI001CD638D2|nr:right-handed parallel beta-helix repeat-containing protein [Lutimonas saemankumensis]MCA0932640.1 right-handed parallel beta-helix repeat-containing protein [Lutimonas saemankumensis]
MTNLYLSFCGKIRPDMNLIRKSIILGLFMMSLSLQATEYFVSNSGSDSNDGLSPETAWKTLNKVNLESGRFKAGDIIAFRGGDEFYGHLLIKDIHGSVDKPIIITSYGNSRASITGMVKPDKWIYEGNNLWAAVSLKPVYLAAKSDDLIQLAKSTDSRIKDVKSNRNFKVPDFIGQENIKGSTVHVKTQPWRWAQGVVESFNSSTGEIVLKEDINAYQLKNEQEIFVVNHPGFLNNQDYWYYDESKYKFLIYSRNEPVDVRIGNYDGTSRGIEILQSSNIKVENVDISGYSNRCISIRSSSGIEINNNYLHKSKEYAILDYEDNRDIVVQNNICKNGYIVSLYSRSPGAYIYQNEVSEVALKHHLGSSIFYNGNGILASGYGSKTIENYVHDTGYNGIGVHNSNCIVKNNVITGFNLISSDGGAIYCIGEKMVNTLIQENIIIGSKNQTQVNGIYADDEATGVKIHGNSISNTYYGIYMHNTKSVTASKNVIYETEKHGIYLREDRMGFSDTAGGDMVDNVVKNNQIFLLSEEYEAIKSNGSWEHFDFASYSDNIYINPYNEKAFGLRTSILDEKYSIPECNEYLNQELNSVSNNYLWDSYEIKKTNKIIIDNDFEENFDEFTNCTRQNSNDNSFITSDGTSPYLRSTKFSIEKDKTYAVEFDAKTNAKEGFRLLVMEYGGSSRIYHNKTIYPHEEFKRYKILFKSGYDDDNVKLFWKLNDQEISIDNIVLKEVEVVQPKKRSLFLYNRNSVEESKSIPTGTWADLTGKKYSGNILLEPFSSKILLLSKSSLIADAGDDKIICKGESVILTANEASQYYWSNGETTQSIEVNPDITTTYTVTVSDADEVASDDVVVTVRNVIANAGDDKIIDEGQTITLSASGGESYIWNTGETTKDIVVSPSNSTIYSVKVREGLCEDIDTVKVTVNKIPTDDSIIADAGEDKDICLGESIVLTAGGGSNYLWSTGETEKSITVNPDVTTVYSVKVSEGDKSDVDEVTVFVNEFKANAGDDVTILEGETIKLSANQGDSYLWNTGAETKEIEVSPKSDTMYSVTISNGACIDSDSVMVFVNSIAESSPPVSEANAGEDMTICLGETVTLYGSGGDSYLWSSGENTDQIEVSPTETTTYELSVSVEGVMSTDRVTVTVENCNNRIGERNEINPDFYLYPNPTKKDLFISVDNLENDSSFIINDSKGSIVYREILSSQEDYIKKDIDVSGFSEGVYFVRLISLNQNITKKLIVQ